ncbi:unnamed protein product [Cochlearia groenlandica]
MMLRAVIRRASSSLFFFFFFFFFGIGEITTIVSCRFTLVPFGSHARSSFHHRSCPGCSHCSRNVISSFQGTTLKRSVRPFSSDSGDVVEAVVPHMGESITYGTLATFLKKPGDRVEADEAIAQIETDKVTIDIASPASGVIQESRKETVEPGNNIAIISKSADAESHVAPSDKTPEKPASQPSPPAEKPKAEGTKVAEKPKAPAPPPPPSSRQSAKEPQLPPKDRERRVPMTRLRKRVERPNLTFGACLHA